MSFEQELITENPFAILVRRMNRIESQNEQILNFLQNRNATTSTDEVLTIQQAAKFLDLTTQTIYSLVSARKIPFSKPTGSRLYFSRLELIEWLKMNRTSTVQEQAFMYDQTKSLRRSNKGRKAA
ncbi:helix-turn-helix domain-containing protein [Spirosoma linguale]|uniref:DNA binding domain protein, excisionase family n=1 Tax=Spirosoma linguale (strain ATCC 33905 / DSM 74 / LMG 10896 / Claus 1) TaxID=504472 RepID=D2QEV9_SPILD|nr:DNA binding domain protein, excisionase family [Spirosoma linguale DSM 74]